MPRQLPAARELFAGRAAELAELDRVLTAATSPDGRSSPVPPGMSDTMSIAPSVVGATVVISAIGGAGGVGKTWLALAWAHRRVDRFPDGQLFVDLRGFSPAGEPVDATDALRGFLDALGVDRDNRPADPDRQAALYRSLIADRRMLIVLDNAATTEQIVPLLPGGDSCTVLITSRHRLPALLTRHGARPLHLDVLADTEAHALLAAALGPDRAAVDDHAVTELIGLCGGFPLALGLIAARAAAEPHLPLADTVAELRDLGLDALHSDDPAASLPTVLSWSLRRLTEQQRTVFALLGIAPGPDTGLPAAANLIGLPARETHAVLRELADASLIDRTPGGRYAMHDLVRAYAATHAHTLPERVRLAALDRVVDFYVHTAHTAGRLVEPQAPLIRPEPPASGVRPHPLPDQPAAMAWMDSEHPHLLAAQHTAATHLRHHAVWDLAWNMTVFHQWRGRFHDELVVWRAALDAAAHLPDPALEIRAHRYVGRAHSRLGRHDEATRHLRQAFALAEHHHDTHQQAAIHHDLAVACGRRGDYRQALEHARRVLELTRTFDNPVVEARGLNAVGWFAAHLGEYATARDHCQASLSLSRLHHHADGEADTLRSLGFIDHHTGDHQQAIRHYGQALALHRALGDIYGAANILDDLGHPYAALGRQDQAREVWGEALTLYREQGRDTDVERVQRQLADLDGTAGTDPATSADGPSRGTRSRDQRAFPGER